MREVARLGFQANITVDICISCLSENERPRGGILYPVRLPSKEIRGSLDALCHGKNRAYWCQPGWWQVKPAISRLTYIGSEIHHD